VTMLVAGLGRPLDRRVRTYNTGAVRAGRDDPDPSWWTLPGTGVNGPGPLDGRCAHESLIQPVAVGVDGSANLLRQWWI